MPRVVVALVLVGVAGATLGPQLFAQKPPAPSATGARLNACTILPREEVKKIFPCNVDAIIDKDEEIKLAGGSACVYPSVQLYVDEYSAAKIEAARKHGPLTSIGGLGDEAFIQQKGKNWVELYVKVGRRFLHIEKDIFGSDTLESVKPSMIALARAVIVKLPAIP